MSTTLATRTIAWLLVLAAVGQLLVSLWMNGLFDVFPYIDVWRVLTSLQETAPFLIAAGVVIGMRRWPAGRSWLAIGVALLVIHGVLKLAMDAWWGWASANDPELISGLVGIINAQGVLRTVLGGLAYAALALGLRPSQPLAGGRRPWAFGLAALGVLATAGWLYPTVQSGWFDRSPGLLALVAWTVASLVPLAVAFLGIAALRAMPQRYVLPELLVGIGVSVWLAWWAWVGWFYFYFSMGPGLPEAFFYVANVVGFIGPVAVAIGFALGAASAPGVPGDD